MDSSRGDEDYDKETPFLFGLCLEVFSRSIQATSLLPTYHFHLMCAGARITHLVYADDLLFARADEVTITSIADCLADFGERAGLLPNLSKSNLYIAGVTDRTTSRLLEITGFQCGTFPFRYLGIPLAAEKLRTSNYGPLTEAIMRRLAAWPKQTLSYVGKLELVKTVLQGIECF